jgi:hypothetical protein
VLVPAGRRVGVNQLFTRPAKALPVVAREFRRAYRRQHPSLASCLENVPQRPTARNYGHVALLPGGLAVGSGAAACTWAIGTIPYARLHPYFSHLARRLIHGVRRPAAAP